ncbi:hypothetical protein M3210_02930 [Oceanobacillus luteolus]|uniref:hypothetical protein n=1 Tax=Oceanobacillus luteolus TaxID=1274358 RepID=UPI00203CA4AE|nr:hypothetical protein [Oceanobacillus luteolus]MCM3739217.1 hypothetical protein [Oceanobacillus luteolus]
MLATLTAVDQRKSYLKTRLRGMGVHLSKDNRNIDYLSLYELEWLHIEVLNEQ